MLSASIAVYLTIRCSNHALINVHTNADEASPTPFKPLRMEDQLSSLLRSMLYSMYVHVTLLLCRLA